MDRRWWADRCDQPLPEELRAYLDGLRRPPSPFASEAFSGPATFGITTDGRLRYDLAPTGDSRPQYLAPVAEWIESIDTLWDHGCRNLLAAHGLVERARDILCQAPGLVGFCLMSVVVGWGWLVVCLPAAGCRALSRSIGVCMAMAG
ncbi:hypothetical protein B6G06_02010 [Actinomyces gaoshouyii]|nr:hypothetical protein B6G06_02010 [Actinomyces gaoshouyii]